MTEHKKLTGYPSIDKPWLKYYSEEAINAPLPKCSIFEYLWENNKDSLDAVAIEYFGNRITYRELFDNIEWAAAAFSKLGVEKGDSVVIVSVTLPEIIYSFYALNKIGAVPNMVDPRTNADGIIEYANESNAKALIMIDAACEKLDAIVSRACAKSFIIVSPANSLTGIRKYAYRSKVSRKKSAAKVAYLWKSFFETGEHKKNASNNSDNKSNKDDCCVIVHTGGTSGTPKGVMISNYQLNATVVQCSLSGFNMHRGDRWLGIMPPFIAYGIGNGLHLPLCKGMTLVLIPAFDPEKYDRLLLKHKPQHIVGVPSHYGSVVKSSMMRDVDLSFIVSPVVGGDGVEINNEKQINAFLNKHNCKTNLIKGYGMTEICAAVCTTARMDFNKEGSVGIPMTHSAIAVFDPDTCEELMYNQCGEICMQGPHIMLGYYKNKSETNQVLRRHSDSSIWLHSGDLGYMDEDGCVFILGRIKRMIIRHDGFKVFPTMIETTIMTNQNVEECCAVGKRDSTHSQGQLPHAFVVLKNDCKKTHHAIKHEISEKCRHNLPEYAQPKQIHFVESLPLTSIGKVDYRALEKLAEENE